MPAVTPTKETSNLCAQNGLKVPFVNGLDSSLAVSEIREISTTDQNGEVVQPPVEEDEIKLIQDEPMEVEELKEPELLAARCCEYVPKSRRKVRISDCDTPYYTAY